MKIRNLTVLAVVLIGSHARATISLEFQFGTLTDSSATTVTNNALWAIIYDDNGDGVLPGGLNSDSSLIAADAAIANADFLGVTVEVDGMVAGDRILFSGPVDGLLAPGIVAEVRNFDPTSLGLDLVEGRRWGLYWFPGLTSGSNTLPGSGSFEVGGFQEDAANAGSGGIDGMLIPADGSASQAFYFDNTITLGASGLDDSRFQAIEAVPEPSALLLGALGSLMLVRRRRS